jgi:hypothetical protein
MAEKEKYMALEVTFSMSDPDPKKHSTKFGFEKLESVTVDGKLVSDEAQLDSMRSSLKNAAFYIPKPLAEDADRIRVTIVEL